MEKCQRANYNIWRRNTETNGSICSFFKNVYIKNTIADKKPPSSVETSNQYDAAGNGVSRTTTRVKDWHRGLQTHFNGCTPNIPLLLENLEESSEMQKFKHVQETDRLLWSNRPVSKNSKIWFRISYEFGNDVPCLRATAKIG